MVKNPYFSFYTIIPQHPVKRSSTFLHPPISSLFNFYVSPCVKHSLSLPSQKYLPPSVLVNLVWSIARGNNQWQASPGRASGPLDDLLTPLLRVPLHLYFSFCSLHSPPFPSAFFSVHSCLNNSQNHIWHLISLPLASLWRSSGKTFKDTLGFCGDLCGLDVGRWGLNVELRVHFVKQLFSWRETVWNVYTVRRNFVAAVGL